ncbi:hypothetical protein BC826DRAFT_1042118, partial [Russula brevipes]
LGAWSDQDIWALANTTPASTEFLQPQPPQGSAPHWCVALFQFPAEHQGAPIEYDIYDYPDTPPSSSMSRRVIQTRPLSIRPRCLSGARAYRVPVGGMQHRNQCPLARHTKCDEHCHVGFLDCAYARFSGPSACVARCTVVLVKDKRWAASAEAKLSKLPGSSGCGIMIL